MISKDTKDKMVMRSRVDRELWFDPASINTTGTNRDSKRTKIYGTLTVQRVNKLNQRIGYLYKYVILLCHGCVKYVNDYI